MQRRVWQRCALSAASVLWVIGASAAARAEGGPTVKAVWQIQELSLTYMGFTSRYSCEGMRDKVANWVKQIGANANSIVSVGACDQPSGPARMPGVRILLAMPAAADSSVTAANAKYPKRAQVLERLQRKSKTPLTDAPFDAQRKTVTLQSKSTIEAGAAGDCELLENFRDQVLKKIDARIVQDNLGCVPHQGTVGNPSLQVEVLNKTP